MHGRRDRRWELDDLRRARDYAGKYTKVKASLHTGLLGNVHIARGTRDIKRLDAPKQSGVEVILGPSGDIRQSRCRRGR